MTSEEEADVAAERARLRRVKAERKAREGVDTVFITSDGPVERWVITGERLNHYVDVSVDAPRTVMWDCPVGGPQERSRAAFELTGGYRVLARELEGLGYARVTV